METQGTSKSKRTNAKGGKDKQTNVYEGNDKQSRRLWTNKEEDTLLGVMLEVFTGGKYKAENGFKSDFYNDCEKHFLKILPGTNLRAQPNIESNVKYWKLKYGQISDMIKLSGFAWNHLTKSIEVDSQSVWTEYEKVNIA